MQLDTETTIETTTVGEFLIRRLKETGVGHIFGVPGDFNLNFLEQIEADPDIRWIGTCNELNSAYAADGYARTAGYAALLTTYGVGELSAINGVAGACSERVPVVVITGAPPLSSINRRALLHHTLADGNYDNMMTCMRQFTVAQALLTPQNAVSEIDRCLLACVTQKRPVYLQLPSDVALLDITVSQTKPLSKYVSDAKMLDEFIRRLLFRLHSAKLPALLVDADIDRFRLDAQLRDLLEASRLPVAMLPTAKGIISENHPQCLGVYNGSVSRLQVRETIENSDCLITFGARLTDATTGAFSQSIDAASEVKINDWFGSIDGEEFYGISMSDSIERLTAALRDHPLERVPASANSTAPSSSESLTDDTLPLNPVPLSHATFWKRIGSVIRENDVVIAENGTPLSGIGAVPLPPGVRVISQPIWGSIGYTLPATLGSVIAAPERRHLLFIGDGSLQVTVQELSTILRHRLRPVIFLLNNDGYTIERLILGENAAYNDIQPWRYSDLCAVFGGNLPFQTFRVETLVELESALVAVQQPDSCVFIEVILPRMDAPPSLTALGPVFARLDYGIKWEMQGFPGGKPAVKRS